MVYIQRKQSLGLMVGHSLLLFLCVVTSDAFVSDQPCCLRQPTTTTLSPFELEMAKIKRGRLGSNVDAASSSSAPRPEKKKAAAAKRSPKKKKGKAAKAAAISPGLSEWMSQQQEGGDSLTEVEIETMIDDDTTTTTTTTTFEKFNKEDKSGGRRSRQKVRQAQEEERNAKISNILKSLEEALDPEKKSSFEDILFPVRQLLKLDGQSNLRQLTSGASTKSFRLAWVGSDDAICHIGTGLHKVPLARLQELFLSFTGRNGFEILEVIRVLGPFPNVKNILQGKSKIISKNLATAATEIEITYDSMVDGTGKEVMAGTENNIREVKLHVLFSDEKVVVAVTPEEEDGGLRKDPFENNGYNLLVFVRENDLDEQLEKLRVA